MEIDIKGLDEPRTQNPLTRTAEASVLKFPISMLDWPLQITCPELSRNVYFRRNLRVNFANEPYAFEYRTLMSNEMIVVFND